MNKKGIILLYVIVVGSILLLITLSVLILVFSEIRFAGRIDDSTRAFYAAESGTEYSLRHVLDGGTLTSTEDCIDTTDLERESPPGGAVRWTDLKIRRITNSVGAQFLRIQVTGIFSEINRNLAIDFTPTCRFSDRPGKTFNYDPETD